MNDDHEPVIVTRARGKPVVMVSLEDWTSMDETTYRLASPAKPGPLKNDYSGHWSRRIDREHRLVYRATATALENVACRYHH